MELMTLNSAVSLYSDDVTWMQRSFGENWLEHIRELVHEQIRRIEVRAKIERLEEANTPSPLASRNKAARVAV